MAHSEIRRRPIRGNKGPKKGQGPDLDPNPGLNPDDDPGKNEPGKKEKEPGPGKKPEKKEAKENQKKLETLNRAVEELKKVAEKFAEGSAEKKRAKHALASVEYALKYLGKKGAPAGKYTVEVKGADGKVAYTQYEGVPVDEVVDLLKIRAKEIKAETTAVKVAELKIRVAELEHQYEKENSIYDKVEVYKKLDVAKREYEGMKKEFEEGFPTSKVLEDLSAKLGGDEMSQTYFEHQYTKEHGEDPEMWTQEERDKQDLRTRHEAHLISKDYRATGSVESDYQAGMEVMRKRRELDLTEEEEEEEDPAPEPTPEPPPVLPTPEPPQPTPPTPEPTPGPVKPELPTPIPPTGPEVKRPERAALVNAEAQVDLLSRERGINRLNEKLNQAGWLKRRWVKVWEEGYRQQMIAEERKKILGQENKPGWIRKKLFGAEEFAATGKKNLFAKTGQESEHQLEAGALANRFSQGYISHSEGEQREQMEDPEFNKQINDLIFEYATGKIDDAGFETRKEALIEQIAKKYPNTFAEGGLTADNLLEAAKDFRKIQTHAEGLAREDVNLVIDLGKAKQAIKTKANLNWVDKVAGKAQKYLGVAASPEALGFAASIGSYFSKKPLYWLGGAAGLGGFLGAVERNLAQKHDLEMHRIQHAMGDEISDYGKDAEKRIENEKYNYKTEKATDLAMDIDQLHVVFEKAPTPENAAKLTKALAEAEARHSLSENRSKDLLSFNGRTVLERNRFNFMRALAEAKVILQKHGFNSDITTTQDYKDSMTSLGGEMDKIDSSERWHRWKENAKAAVVGAVGGVVIGGLAQEGLALIADRVSWLSWLRPGGKATSMEKFAHYLGATKVKGMHWLAEHLYEPSSAGAFDAFTTPDGKGVLKIDNTTDLIYDKTTGLHNLVDKTDHSKILAKVNIDIVTHKATLVPGSYNPDVIDMAPTTTVKGSSRPINEWMDPSKSHFGKGVNAEVWHTVGHLDNNTTLPKIEFNELRFYMQFDSHGNLSLDPSKLQEYLENPAAEQIQGSRHGDKALEVMEAFKKGTLQIGIAPDPAHPENVLALVLDPVTHKFTVSGGGANDLMNAFESDGKGHPVYKGNGFLGTGHILGTNADGSKNVEWVNAIRGNGHEISTGDSDRIINEITTKKPNGWWGPWVYSQDRKGLELKKKKGPEKEPNKDWLKDIPEYTPPYDKDGKRIVPGGPEGKPDDHFDDDYDEKDIVKKIDKLSKGKVKKVTTAARGQARGTEKDFFPDFPEKFISKSPQEIAKLFLDKRLPLLRPDFQAIQSMSRVDAVKYLAGRVVEQRQAMEKEVKRRELIEGAVTHSLEALDELFNKYAPKDKDGKPLRTDLQKEYKDKVHLSQHYEFFGEYGDYRSGIMGFCIFNNGEIFVNMSALANLSEEHQIATIKHIIIHEFTHGTGVNNYWEFEQEGAKDGEKTHVSRRSGILQRRREGASGQKPKDQPFIAFRERGRALNEAVTETLAQEALQNIWPDAPTQLEAYVGERSVLNLLMKKHNIPFEKFAAAAVNREELKRLNESMQGERKLTGKEVQYETESKELTQSIKESVRERPEFLSLVMALMDFEYDRNISDYSLTKQFISGDLTILTPEVLATFPRSLLDEKGDLKPALLSAYKNLKLGKASMPKAA